MLPAPDLVRVLLGVGPGRVAHDLLQRFPFGVGADADRDPLLLAGAGVDVVRGHPVVAVALVFGQPPVHRPVHVELAEHRGHRLALREVDVLAAAGATAVDEGGGHGGGGGDPGDGVAVGDAALVGHAVVAVAAGGGEAGHHLDDRSVADGVALGAGFAEAGHADDDDVVALLAQPFVAEAEVVHHVGAIVLDHHIGLGDQPREERFAFGRGQVEAERLLVAAVLVEVEVGVPPVLAGRGGRRKQGADVVPCAGRFDLDHLCALVGEDFRGVGAGPDHRQVGDADAAQGSAGIRHGASSCSLRLS